MCGEISASSCARSAAARMISHTFWRESRAPRIPRNSAGVARPRADSTGRARTR